MSERSKETVLKTVVVQATASSNLALSAWEGPGRNPGALLLCRKRCFHFHRFAVSIGFALAIGAEGFMIPLIPVTGIARNCPRMAEHVTRHLSACEHLLLVLNRTPVIRHALFATIHP